jgi:hypothetical protein
LNESFKLAEDAAAELHVTFSKLLGNESSIRIAPSSPEFSHNCHGLVAPTTSVYRLRGSNRDRFLHVRGGLTNKARNLGKESLHHLLGFLRRWSQRLRTIHHDLFNVLVCFLTNIGIMLAVE